MPLSAAPLLRLSVRVPPRYVENLRLSLGPRSQKALLSDVEARLERLGAAEVLSVLQDPTDNTALTALARTLPLRSLTLASDGLLRVERVDHVEEPMQRADEASLLDPGLAPEDAWVLRRALAVEDNPRHLDGIATTFEVFPVSASLLRAKAMLLELRAARHRTLTLGLAAASKEPLRHAQPVGQTLRDITRYGTNGRWPEVERMWLSLGRDLPSVWRGPRDHSPSAVQSALKALTSFAHGDPSFEPLRDEVRRAALSYSADPFYALGGDTPEPGRDPIRDAGRATVVELGPGVRVVCPRRMREILPPHPRDGFVAEASLLLALGKMKPGHSRIRSGAQARRISADLDVPRSKTPEERSRLMAKAQVARATRAIERRRWIEWHKQCASG